MNQVALSSGSNEVLSAAVVAWGKEGKILSPDFTYDLHLCVFSLGNDKITSDSAYRKRGPCSFQTNC